MTLPVPAEIVPVDVGIMIVVEDAWGIDRLVPEDVLCATAPTKVPAAATVGCTETTDVAPCAMTETVAPELVALELAACGVGCPAGTSVALLSGRAMDMRERRRSSFSVSKELRLITG